MVERVPRQGGMYPGDAEARGKEAESGARGSDPECLPSPSLGMTPSPLSLGFLAVKFWGFFLQVMGV